MKVLFLYTEIADYFLAGCRALISRGAEVHVVRWPVNKEAPFQFVYPEKLTVYERSDFSDGELIRFSKSLQPNVIVCSGWVDKGYLAVCKAHKKTAATVLTLDNHWQGTWKQRIACLLSPLFLKTRFSNCWVPGSLQVEYALKLGFNKPAIQTGFYTCDYELFHRQYLQNKAEKQQQFPKRFIYVGRYYSFKGIEDLWSAFIELQQEQPNDWELWCLGTGDLSPVQHPGIRHFGFVQPQELPEFIKDTGVFVLPSRFEPWGVVVHEFAAAGFPIICSDKVGSRTAFVENDVNGYIYPSEDKTALKKVLKTMMQSGSLELNAMGDKSVLKAQTNTPAIWAGKVFGFFSKQTGKKT